MEGLGGALAPMEVHAGRTVLESKGAQGTWLQAPIITGTDEGEQTFGTTCCVRGTV